VIESDSGSSDRTDYSGMMKDMNNKGKNASKVRLFRLLKVYKILQTFSELNNLEPLDARLLKGFYTSNTQELEKNYKKFDKKLSLRRLASGGSDIGSARSGVKT